MLYNYYNEKWNCARQYVKLVGNTQLIESGVRGSSNTITVCASNCSTEFPV